MKDFGHHTNVHIVYMLKQRLPKLLLKCDILGRPLLFTVYINKIVGPGLWVKADCG